MENPELLLLEIEEFNRNSNAQDDRIPQNLENFIEYVSKTGTYIFPWNLVKKLFMKKIQNIINNLQSCMSLSSSDLNTSSSPVYGPNLSMMNDANSIQLIKDRIIERMKSFTSAPFTIQRICELLLKPNSHYNRVDKYLRGLEKCIMVVTTVDPNGNKIFMENFLTNGVSSSNLSTPIITPTRPTTPPEATKEAVNESLNLATTPIKDIEEVKSEETYSASNQLRPSKSDEALSEYKTEFNELNQINKENEVTENIKENSIDSVVESSISCESTSTEITEKVQDNSIEINSVEANIEIVSSSDMIEANSNIINTTDKIYSPNVNIEEEIEMDGIKTSVVSVTTTTTELEPEVVNNNLDKVSNQSEENQVVDNNPE
jgi:serine/threonine-protein phosphatase 4 regulatory subunit 2